LAERDCSFKATKEGGEKREKREIGEREFKKQF
jgi:hypothetical protein